MRTTLALASLALSGLMAAATAQATLIGHDDPRSPLTGGEEFRQVAPSIYAEIRNHHLNRQDAFGAGEGRQQVFAASWPDFRFKDGGNDPLDSTLRPGALAGKGPGLEGPPGKGLQGPRQDRGQASSIPEPMTLGLLAAGLVGLAVAGRRRARRQD